MAEEKTKGKEARDSGSATDKPGGKTPWVIWGMLAAVVIGGSMGGFALCQLVGGTDSVCPAAGADSANPPEKDFDDYLSQKAGDQMPWTYDQLEPVVANLDEPGVTRYVRISITLEMSPEMDPAKGVEYLDKQRLVLRDWLTTYFAGLSLEDVRGSRNLERIKRHVLDQYNEILFPSGRPYVKRILFKEFAVQ